ncbi:MAG: DsrE family protein [Bacillota bacterium]
MPVAAKKVKTQDKGGARFKVLFHINESDRWQRVLVNITNFLNDAGQGNADIEVVANGEAVSVFRNSCLPTGGGGRCCGPATGALMEQMKQLSEMGVNFAACRNALKAQSIDEGSLPDFVTVVPAGITDIARKQAEGYAYIKP